MAAETELERLVVRLIGDGKSYEKTLRDASKSTQKYTKDIDGRLRDAQGKFVTGHKKMAHELSQTTSLMKKAGIIASAYGEKLRSVGEGVSRVGRSLSLRITLPLTALGVAAIKFGADFDSGFAGVRKTVNATEAELADLRKEFKLLLGEIPTDAAELLGIGEIAGQLGIATGNIISFTKTIAQMGVTTNLTFEEAASDMAKFANITGMAQDRFSNLGSAIVALGNSTATTERDILSMSMRLAGAGSTIGLAESQIIGLAAALSSVGLRSEAGGTAFSKLMLDMSIQVATGGDKIKAFANLTGRSIAEFSELFREDAAGAIQALLRGLSELDDESRILALKAIGVEGTRMTDAVLRASGAVDLLEKSLKTSEDAFKANTALAKEAEVRFKTFWSQVALLKNQFKLLLTEVFEQLEPALRKVVDMTKEATVWFRNLSPEIKKVAAIVAIVVAAIGPLLIGLGSLVSLIGFALPGALVAAKVAVVALIVVGFAVLLKKIYETSPAIRQLNKELKRTVELTAQIASKITSQQQGILQTGRDMTGSAPEKKSFFEEQLKRAGRELVSVQGQLEASRREADRLAPTWKSAWISGKPFWDAQNQVVKENEQRVKSLRGFVKELRGELSNLPKAKAEVGVEKGGAGFDTTQFLKRSLGVDGFSFGPLKQIMSLQARIIRNTWIEDLLTPITRDLDEIREKAKINVDFTVTGIDTVAADSARALARVRSFQFMHAGERAPRPAPQQAGGLMGSGLKPRETGEALGKSLGEAFVGLLEQKKDTFKDVLTGILEASGLN